MRHMLFLGVMGRAIEGVLFAFCGLLVLVGAVSCSRGSAVGANSAPGPQAASQPAGASGSNATALDINTVADKWIAGKHDEAIELLLRLGRSSCAPACYRPYQLSEKQFIALPKAEQDSLREEMMARMRVVIAVALEVEARAKKSLANGDVAGAEKLFRAIKQLGASNRGPEVTQLANFSCKGIEERGDAGLAEVAEQRGKRSSP